MEKDKADRYNQGKLQWHLIDWKSLEPMVEVLMFGAKKYAPNNWKRGLDPDEVLDCTMRHLVAVMNNQEYDEESNKHHMGHVMCNAMFYLHFYNKTKRANEIH